VKAVETVGNEGVNSAPFSSVKLDNSVVHPVQKIQRSVRISLSICPLISALHSQYPQRYNSNVSPPGKAAS